MTAATAQARVYQLLGQSSADSQYATTMVDAFVNIGRRALAAVLPDWMLPNLKSVGSGTTSAAGFLAFATGFVRMMENSVVTVATIPAHEVKEAWRWKYLSHNVNSLGDGEDKYYRVKNGGIEVSPAAAVALTYDYIKVPGDLAVADNADLPGWVEDLSIDFAYERLIGTKMGGDTELALYLLRQRGLIIQGVGANVRTDVQPNSG